MSIYASIYEQFLREIKKSIISPSLEYGDKKLSFTYFANTFDRTGIICHVYNKGQIVALFKGEENVMNELKKIPVSVIEMKLKEIENEKHRYQEADERLKKIAENIAQGKELMKLLSFIDCVCTPARYCGMRNRVYISENVHLRLADSSRWKNEGELHLQKVISSGGRFSFHKYPQETEEALLREVLSCDFS